jgi:hypothetical protein
MTMTISVPIFDAFCEHFEMDEEDRETFAEFLVEAAKQATGGESDPHIKSFLKDLGKHYPQPEKRYPNQEGNTPLAGEDGTKAFLKKLPVNAYPDSYGNDAFSASKYKAYDREAHRQGKNYSAKNDYNNQTPTYPLQNPILNVNPNNVGAARARAFEAVDSVGMGMIRQYRVLNTITGEYVTKQGHRDEATALAEKLKRELAKQQIDEANAKRIASTPITENLFKPLDPRYVAYLNKSTNPANSRTMDGGAYQSSNPAITAMADFRATALLNERAKAKFQGDTDVTEGNAIRSRSQKGNPRRSEPVMSFDSSSDRDFLADINKRSLIEKK